MEKNIWNAPYFQRRNWILENMEDLHLDGNEAITVLVIDYWKETNRPVNQKQVAQKLKLSEDEVEKVFDALMEKGYINVSIVNGAIEFDMQGLYDLKGNEVQEQYSLIERFEFEMKRTLSSNDIQRILNLSNRFGERMTVVALNEAVVYEKVNLNYIEKILVSWAEKGYDAEDVENGQR